ncbi:MAG: DMT family transporter [Streptosporangiales bacterium]|nr:DMT family transporter [Streptosporangiales bacterium]
MRFSMLCLTLCGVLWGTGGLLGSLLGQVAGLSPLSVACIRLLAGGGLMVAFLLLIRARRPRGRRAWRRIAVNGLLSAVFQGCYFGAISLTSVSLATLVTIGAAPVIVTAVERARGGRPLGLKGVITQGLALVGLVLLVGGPVLTGGAGTTGSPGAAGSGAGAAATLAGCGLALASAAAFAAITLIGSSPVPGLRDLTVNGYGFTLGGLILVPFAATAMAGAPGGAFRSGLTVPELLAAAGLLAGLVIGPTAVAYTLYYRGLRAESASTAALLTLLEPLTAAVLGIVLLGDRLGVAGITGAVILGAALVRAALAPAPAPASPSALTEAGERRSAGGSEGEQAGAAEAVAGEG